MNTFRTARAPFTPQVFRAGTGRYYDYVGPGIRGVCLAESRQTGGTFSAFELTFAPGAELPLHAHANEDETFYVREGQFDIQRGNELFELQAGMCLFGPRDIAHGVINSGDAEGRLLVLVTPGNLEEFFRALDKAGETLGDLHTREARTEYGLLLENWDMHPVMKTWRPTRRGAPVAMPVSDLGNHRGRFLVSTEETNGTFLLTHVEVDPQGGTPPHVHHEEDEAFFLLSGQLEVRLGETVTQAGPGDIIFGPRNVPHSWHNAGQTPAFGLRLVTPGENAFTFAQDMQAFLRRAGGKAVAEISEPTLVRQMNTLFEQHDLELLPAMAR